MLDQAIQLLQENYTEEQVHHILCQATIPIQQIEPTANKPKPNNTNKQAIIFVEELLDKIFATTPHNKPTLQHSSSSNTPP